MGETYHTVSVSCQLPYGGAGDSRAGPASLADRFRRHADSLARSKRRACTDAVDVHAPVGTPERRLAVRDDDGLAIHWEAAA